MTRVVDGDTVKAQVNGREDTVRYIGIDTPESVKPNTPVQCFAEQASHYNEHLVEGRKVELVPGREQRDRYGRLLAYLYLETGGHKEMVNADLLRLGYARTLSIPPNTKFAKKFATLQAGAANANRGLWGACSQ